MKQPDPPQPGSAGPAEGGASGRCEHPAAPAALELVDVSVLRQRRGEEPRKVIDGLHLRVEVGQRVALVGPNGAGKTSLLLALVGAAPFRGTIAVGGVRLERSSLAQVRQTTGYVFADPADQLFLPTAGEEVAFGPRQRGLVEPALSQRVEQALAAVGLEGYQGRLCAELSLGEQRRLAVATILSTRPALLLLDEPTASLDPRARRKMLESIVSLGAAVLLATHDLDAALDLGARVVALGEGRVVGDGPAERVLADEAVMQRAGLEVPYRLRAAWPVGQP